MATHLPCQVQVRCMGRFAGATQLQWETSLYTVGVAKATSSRSCVGDMQCLSPPMSLGDSLSRCRTTCVSPFGALTPPGKHKTWGPRCFAANVFLPEEPHREQRHKVRPTVAVDVAVAVVVVPAGHCWRCTTTDTPRMPPQEYYSTSESSQISQSLPNRSTEG